MIHTIFSNDEERLCFILDEEQPDELKMPLLRQISDDRLLIKIIEALKPFRRFADEKEHKDLVLSAAKTVRDGKLLEKAADGFRDETVHWIYPVLVEKCPRYTPEFVVHDKHARDECKREAYEAIKAQAVKEGRFVYISTDETGEEWFSAKWRWTDPMQLVYADMDPYISIACYGACESDVLVDEKDGRLDLWECRPGAFAELYQGLSFSLYKLPEALFLKRATNWETTRVCIDRAPVIFEEIIEDAWHTLEEAARKGLCAIHEYSESDEYETALDLVSERIRRRKEKPLFIIDEGALVKYEPDPDNPVDLEELAIPDGVTSIGWHAFYDIRGIESIRIPDSVRVIEEEAFYGCTFNHVEIPEGVTTIEAWAFGNCEYLNEVRIPDSVTSIGPWAFGYRRNYRFYHDPEPVNRHRHHPPVCLIGKKGGEAQRYAQDNEWYDCCLIAKFREADQH